MKLTNARRLRTPVLCLALATAAAVTLAPLAVANGGGDSGGSSSGSSYGDSSKIKVTGSIIAECHFQTKPTQTSVGALVVTGTPVYLGSFGFVCNLVTGSTVQLTVKSDNGALQRDGGTEKVPYEVVWNVQAGSLASGNVGPWQSGFTFPLITLAPGNEKVGTFGIKLVGPVEGKPAGAYGDTLTYTISP